jgi:hypothetical protein
MAAHFSLIFLSLTVLSYCSTGAIAGLSLKEQMQHLQENYVNSDKISINEINKMKW